MQALVIPGRDADHSRDYRGQSENGHLPTAADYPGESISNYPVDLDIFMPGSWADVAFSKLDSSITISASPASVTYGKTIKLSASIKQTVSRGDSHSPI